MPNPEADPAQPFDEDAVLRDLEQLRGQIMEARSRRERKAAEFDSFVKEARAVSQAERLAAVEQLEATTRAQSAARMADRAATSASVAQPPPFVSSQDSTPVSRRVVIPRARAPQKRFGLALPFKQPSRVVLGIAGGAVLAVLAFVLFSGSGSDATPSPQPSVGQQAASQPQSKPTPAAAPAQPAAKPDPRPIQIQLEAVRDVWMQVVADGRREIGRTVPKGQRLSFGANNEINLRAGDAGAVRLFVAGADRGVLGRDGQVVNRRFTK